MRVYKRLDGNWSTQLLYYVECDSCGERMKTFTLHSTMTSEAAARKYFDACIKSYGYLSPGDDQVKEYCIDCKGKK